MKLRELLNYLDHVPVEPKEGQTRDEALLNMDIKLRVCYASGQYNQITDLNGVTVERLPFDNERTIIINTGECG